MAKKKSAAKQEETQQNVVQHDEIKIKPTNPENTIVADDVEHKGDKLKPTNPENTIVTDDVEHKGDKLKPTNPENDIIPEVPADNELHVTGEINLDDVFVDSQVMSRLRSSLLSPSEIYQESQLFNAQNLNVASLLKSGESILMQNTLEILRVLDIWVPESPICLLDSDEHCQELASRYILQCLKRERVSPLDAVLAYETVLSSVPNHGNLSAFSDKLCASLLSIIDQPKADITVAMTALTRLCGLMPTSSVSRLIYDPTPAVRIAVIRSLALRPSLDINDLSVCLVLLKDRDEQVNIAIMRLLAHFSSYPEFVIPQILPIFTASSDELRKEILNVFKGYNNDAVEPVMQALGSTQTEIYDAVRVVIAQSAQRYTDALIKVVLSTRTHEHVRERAIEILKKHQDPSRQDEITRVLNTILPPPIDPNVEWVPPETSPKFIPRATDKKAVYEKLLDDSEIAELSANCPEEVLSRLLCDANETVQINALHVIRYRKQSTPALTAIVNVWMKSASPSLASEALDAYLTVESDLDVAVGKIIEAFEHGESADVKKHFFDVLAQHQNSINALIRAYYQTPRKCSGFVRKFLMMNPNKTTLKAILAGLGRKQSVACIVETMLCLLNTKVDFDNNTIRPELLAHLREPVSFGQHGFEARLLSIKLLRKYLTQPDEPRDDAAIASLQAFYKEAKNAELKKNTKDLLKDLGEEIFDFDDEDDDFEDLNDEDDE